MKKRNCFIKLKAYENNCSIGGGGTLELPYRIRLFSVCSKRMGCRDPVLFPFLERFYVLKSIDEEERAVE